MAQYVIKKIRLQVTETETYPYEISIDTKRQKDFLIWVEGQGHYYMSGYLTPAELISDKWQRYIEPLDLHWLVEYIQTVGADVVTAKDIIRKATRVKKGKTT